MRRQRGGSSFSHSFAKGQTKEQPLCLLLVLRVKRAFGVEEAERAVEEEKRREQEEKEQKKVERKFSRGAM